MTLKKFIYFILSTSLICSWLSAHANEISSDGKLELSSFKFDVRDHFDEEVIDGEQFIYALYSDELGVLGDHYKFSAKASIKNLSNETIEFRVNTSVACFEMYNGGVLSRVGNSRSLVLAPGESRNIYAAKDTIFMHYFGEFCGAKVYARKVNTDGSLTVFFDKEETGFHVRTLVERCGQRTVLPEQFVDRGAQEYNSKAMAYDYFNSIYPILKRCPEDYVIPNYLDEILGSGDATSSTTNAKGKGRGKKK